MNKKLKEGKGESFLHTRKINFKKLNSKKINLLKFIKNIDLNATLMCANNNQAKANGGVLFHKINRIDSNKVKANRYINLTNIICYVNDFLEALI